MVMRGLANMAINPFPQTPPMTGMLAGYYQGTQHNYGLADLERQFRDSDLKYQSDTNKYQNELLDNPMKEQERLQKIANAQYETDLVNSGAKRDAFDTEVTSKKVNTEGQKLLNKEREITIASDALLQADSLPELSKEAMWEQLRGELTGKGVKFPTGPYTVEASKQLKAMAQASMQTRAHLQALQKQEEQAVLLEASKYNDRRSNEAIQERHDIRALQSARIMAEAQANKPPTGTAYEQAVKQVREKTAKGEPVSASEIVSIASLMVKEDTAGIKKLADSVMSSLVSQNTKDKASMERFVAGFGMSPEELAKYKLKSGSYDINPLGTTLAKDFIQYTTLTQAWDSAGAPKLNEADWKQIQTRSPNAAKYIADQGGVVPKDYSKKPSTTTQKSVPADNVGTTTTPGIVKGDWNAFVSQAVEDQKKYGHNKTFAEVQKALLKAGWKPEGSPPVSPVETVPLPSQSGLRSD